VCPQGVRKRFPERTPCQTTERLRRAAKTRSPIGRPVNVSLGGGYPDGCARGRLGSSQAFPGQRHIRWKSPSTTGTPSSLQQAVRERRFTVDNCRVHRPKTGDRPATAGGHHSREPALPVRTLRGCPIAGSPAHRRPPPPVLLQPVPSGRLPSPPPGPVRPMSRVTGITHTVCPAAACGAGSATKKYPWGPCGPLRSVLPKDRGVLRLERPFRSPCLRRGLSRGVTTSLHGGGLLGATRQG
jgi:hypothetical protein